MTTTMSPALAATLARDCENETEPVKPRVNRARTLVDALAEEGIHLSIGDARSLLNQRVDSIAAYVGVSRAHLLRQHIDETWVRNFARSIARAHTTGAAADKRPATDSAALA